MIWHYRNKVRVFDDSYDRNNSGIKRIVGRVLEIIDHDDVTLIYASKCNFMYVKKDDIIVSNDVFFIKYDCVLYRSYQDNDKLCTYICVNHSINIIPELVDSLSSFVRYLTKARNIEYDPKKVDHGTVIYKRLSEPGIRYVTKNRLSDLVMIRTH